MNPLVAVVAKSSTCNSKLASSTANSPIGLFPVVLLFLVVFFSSVVWIFGQKIFVPSSRCGISFRGLIAISDFWGRQLEIMQFVRLGQYVVPVPVSTPYPAKTNSREFSTQKTARYVGSYSLRYCMIDALRRLSSSLFAVYVEDNCSSSCAYNRQLTNSSLCSLWIYINCSFRLGHTSLY